MAVVLPLILLLYDYYYDNRGQVSFPGVVFRAIKSRYYQGYCALVVFFLVQKVFLLKPAGFVMGKFIDTSLPHPGGSILSALPVMLRAFGWYIRFLLFPVKLSIEHEFPVSTGIDPALLFSAALFIAVLALAVVAGKKARGVSFSLFCFLVCLIPVSNIVPMGKIIAERYLYFSSMGFCLLLGIILTGPGWKVFKSFKVKPAVLLVVVLFLFAARTIVRNRDFSDGLALWSSTLRVYPDSVKALSGRGDAYREKEFLDRAIASYDRALELDPEYIRPIINRGMVYGMKGLYDKALADFDRALKLDPKNPLAYNNRGITYGFTGDYRKSIRDFNRAIELNPHNSSAYRNRALTRRKMEEEKNKE